MGASHKRRIGVTAMNLLLGIHVVLLVVLQSEGKLSLASYKEIEESLEAIENDVNKLEESQVANIIEEDVLVLPEREGNLKRSIVSDYRWPNRTVYYEISSSIRGYRREMIKRAMLNVSSETCVTFKERTTEKYWVKIQSGHGCSSYLGRLDVDRQPQPMNLNWRCFYSFGTIIHSLLHALGLPNEHTRPDRDQYVAIVWGNIRSGKESNFWKDPYAKTLGLNYDYNSVMQYGRNYFSSNRTTKDTVVTLDPKYMKEIGQRKKMSIGDRIHVNLMYFCQGKTNYVGEWTQFSPCTDKCTKSRQRWCDIANNTCSQVAKDGLETHTVTCTNSECNVPVDGNWGHWSTFVSCIRTSLDDKTTRTRTCTNPAPKHGGRPCIGIDKETRFCQCGGVYNATEKTSYIESPGFPYYYPHNQTCTYRITAPPGTFVRIKFLTFNLEYDSECKYDSVTIYADSRKERRIARLCTLYWKKEFHSTDPTMVVVFKSDIIGNYLGFIAEIEAVWQPTTASPTTTPIIPCGGHYNATDTPGYISSPGYPGNYPPNKYCRYEINAPTGSFVKLTIKSLWLEYYSGCIYDDLRIFYDIQERMEIARLCGYRSRIKPFYSTGSTMVLVFMSDNTYQYSGFRVKYEAHASRT